MSLSVGPLIGVQTKTCTLGGVERLAGVLRAGHICVNVNPLYTARELEHQLNDSGATVIVVLENFAATLAEVIDSTPIKHVVVASMGDLLGFWYGNWITFAVRHLAKMVPAYKLTLSEGRTVTSFRQAMAEGAAMPFKSAASTLDSVAFLQYTGGTMSVINQIDGPMITFGDGR